MRLGGYQPNGPPPTPKLTPSDLKPAEDSRPWSEAERLRLIAERAKREREREQRASDQRRRAERRRIR